MNTKNQTATITVEVEYEDVSGVTYQAEVEVTINKSYQVERSEIVLVTSFDKDVSEISTYAPVVVRLQLESLGAMKALEIIQDEDFSKEAERE